VFRRDVTRDHRLPLSVRHTLSIEAGMNDAVVLPATLVLAVLATGVSRGLADWAAFAAGLLIVGPAIGVAVAVVGIRALVWLRRRRFVRHDYESLYSLGVAFTAYALAEAVGGSGYLAAFSAGVAIAALDVELCECFSEYGKTTAEMSMLVTFLLLGAPLASAALSSLSPATIGFAVLALLVARPLAFGVTMLRSQASWGGRAFMAWFGPRGLNSLLLALLAIGVGIPPALRSLAWSAWSFCCRSFCMACLQPRSRPGTPVANESRSCPKRPSRGPAYCLIAINRSLRYRESNPTTCWLGCSPANPSPFWILGARLPTMPAGFASLARFEWRLTRSPSVTRSSRGTASSPLLHLR
jgi:Kef-type K+ transport system membrane component KefB